jgi:hypothetical protein
MLSPTRLGGLPALGERVIAFVEKLGAKPRGIASLYLGRREGLAIREQAYLDHSRRA